MGRLAQWVVIEADVVVRHMSHDQKVHLADEINTRQPNMPRRPPKLPHLWPLKLLHLAGVN